MIYVTPGSSRNFTVDGAPTGLTGSIGWRVEDEDDQVVVARTTTGVTEFANGAYRKELTFPDDAGSYVVIVDFPSGPDVTIDVTVTPSPPALVAGGALTTLSAVRAFLQLKTTDTEWDGLIEDEFIPTASALIMEHCEREFAPETADSTREFEAINGFINLAPYDLQELIELQVGDSTYTSGYKLRPRPAKDGVYNWIALDDATVCGEVTVQGRWGFPAVPSQIAHWANVTVAIWLRKDVGTFSRVLNLDSERMEFPDALPAAVIAGLARHRRPQLP